MKNQHDSSEDEQAEKKTGNFWRIMGYSTTLDRCFMSAALLCAAGAGATLPLMFIVFGNLVQSFNGYFIPGSGVPADDFRAQVNQSALYIVYIFIAKFGLSYISTFAFRMAGIRISAAMRLAYLTALFDQSIGFIDRLPPGSATDVMTTVANTVQVAIGDKLGALVQGIALIISAYAVAFARSWSLTLISSSTILFLILTSSVALPFYLKYVTLAMQSNTKASGVAGEFLYGIRTVKSLCAEDEAISRHETCTKHAQEYGLKRSIWLTVQYWPAFFAPHANMALTFWAGAKFHNQGYVSDTSDIIVVLFSLLVVVNGLATAFTPLQNILKASAAAVACFQVIDAPLPKQGGLKAPDAQANLTINFRDVAFSYPSRPQVQILKSLSFDVPANKVTAFVGPSGCGKSTIVALLERWYELSDANKALQSRKEENEGKDDEQKQQGNEESIEMAKPNTEDDGQIFQNAGTIFIGPHNIENLDRKWWRSQIGLVQQEPVLFNGTVYENVANGLAGSSWEDESEDAKMKLVQQACEEAYATEFILRLPDGYKTLVGEGGIKLSGGQRQRLAIARSIIKRPAILILDEATSSIDVKGERLVSAALERASKGRTTLMIAHRLSTIKRADHIVVLKDGSMAEQGTHAGLMGYPNGVYASLVQSQSLELGISDEEAEDISHSVNEQETKPREDSDTLPDAAIPEHDKMQNITPKDAQQRAFINSVGLLVYEQRRYYPMYCLVILGCAGAGSAMPLQAFFFSNLVVVFQYTGEKLVSQANHWALLLFILALCIGACYAVIGYCSNNNSVRVSTTYRDEYFNSILRKPISWFDEENHSIGTLTSQLSADPRELEEILGPNIVFPLIAIFSLVGCITISFVFGWKLTLVVFFAAMPVILVSSFFRIRYEVKFDAMNAAVFADSSKFAAESIGAFRTVAALTLEDKILKRYQRLLNEHARNAFMKARFSLLVFALSDSLELCSMALGFWYGGQLLATREYDVLQFFIIYTAIVQGGQAAGQYLAFGPNVARATAAANRIISFRSGSELAPTMEATPTDTSNGHAVEFRNVGFSYPTRSVPVYNALSFTIEAGQYVAFVGPSGCGKTTIISLLERFYTHNSGQIVVNGSDMSQIPLPRYRSSCGLVTQEPTLFEGTIRKNLTLGLPASPSEEEIEKACRDAEIWEFITSLPQSLDTHVLAGTHSSFSGGQKQRLCIARALLRKPRLLLLDEATNSLDSVSEGLIQRAIDRIAGDRSVTVVAVAHRLATVQNADRIFVLGEGGRVEESGTHSELLRRRGVYWSMCNAQALDL